MVNRGGIAVSESLQQEVPKMVLNALQCILVHDQIVTQLVHSTPFHG
jgi:hypothetical protein